MTCAASLRELGGSSERTRLGHLQQCGLISETAGGAADAARHRPWHRWQAPGSTRHPWTSRDPAVRLSRPGRQLAQAPAVSAQSAGEKEPLFRLFFQRQEISRGGGGWVCSKEIPVGGCPRLCYDCFYKLDVAQLCSVKLKPIVGDFQKPR